jgi:serine/threonine protein kinase
MVYTLLYSEFPFLWQERVNSYHNGTAHPTPDYPESITISNEARDLLEKMMSLDPSKRLSLHEVAAHPWLHRRSPKARILAFFRK